MSSMFRSALGALLAATLSVAAPSDAALVTLDFEDYAIGNYGPDYCAPDYCVSGLGVLVDKGFVLDPGLVDWSPNPQPDVWIGHYHIQSTAESKFFLFDYFLDESHLHIYTEHGMHFGLESLDLAITDSMSTCSPNVPPEYQYSLCGITFVGFFADGDVLYKTIVLNDEVANDLPPLTSEFQTISFGDQWNDLVRVWILPHHGYLNPSLDNLVLRVVPEPVGLAWYLFGILAFIVSRDRRFPTTRARCLANL